MMDFGLMIFDSFLMMGLGLFACSYILASCDSVLASFILSGLNIAIEFISDSDLYFQFAHSSICHFALSKRTAQSYHNFLSCSMIGSISVQYIAFHFLFNIEKS